MRAELLLTRSERISLYAIAIGIWVLILLLVVTMIFGVMYAEQLLEVLDGLSRSLVGR